MGLFNFKKEKNSNNVIDLNGYIIDKEQGILIGVPVGLSVYNIPSSVKEISAQALNGMKRSAVEIDFSNNSYITSLPSLAFHHFEKLSKVILPQNLKKMEYFFDEIALNNGVEIILPQNLEQFARNQFSPSIKHLELDDSVSQLMGGIVSHNNVLEELVINGNIKNLPSFSVNQTKFLRELWIKDGVVFMEDNAIRGCNNLTDIHIPESLRNFKLGTDDFRPLNSFKFGGREYFPTEEEIEKERHRTIRLYKMINKTEIIFEVNRSQFTSMVDKENELVFKGPGDISYNIPKEKIINCKYITVDIVNKQMIIKTAKQEINNSSDKKIESNIQSINISSKKNMSASDIKTKIEELLGIKITRTKRIKNKVTGDFVTVLKTQQELSNEMLSLLEDFEEDDIIERLDSKTINEYKRYLKWVYGELISYAPYQELETQDKINEYIEQLRRKYGYYEKNISEQEKIDQIIYSEIDTIEETKGPHRK